MQSQGTLQPLDPEAIAKGTCVAMANAMGGTYLPQPDVRVELWAEIPAGNEEEYDEEVEVFDAVKIENDMKTALDAWIAKAIIKPFANMKEDAIEDLSLATKELLFSKVVVRF